MCLGQRYSCILTDSSRYPIILDCDLAYSTWQSFSQSLLVDSHLLLYIDVWHPNFLPLLATLEKGSAPPNNHPGSQVMLPQESHVLGCLAGLQSESLLVTLGQLPRSGSIMASSFWPEVGWQTTFRLGNEPLLVAASVKTWAQSEGG